MMYQKITACIILIFSALSCSTSFSQTADWKPLTDKLPATQTGSVCVDYTDDQIIYFGTGDPHYYGDASTGVWKTTDRGRNWTRISNGIDNRTVVELLMSPLDHNVLIAATN